MNTVFKIVILLFVFLVGCAVMGGWFASGFLMASSAMDPAIKEGQMCLVNRMATGKPRRGEIVLLQVPKEDGQIIRRVVAFGGETVEVREGAVYVNEARLDEPWLQPPEIDEDFREADRGGDFGPEPVPYDHVFVVGDNRPGSRDSRHFGPVGQDRVMGRVWEIFGPLTF